jgi:hypothetical protein
MRAARGGELSGRVAGTLGAPRGYEQLVCIPDDSVGPDVRHPENQNNDRRLRFPDATHVARHGRQMSLGDRDTSAFAAVSVRPVPEFPIPLCRSSLPYGAQPISLSLLSAPKPEARQGPAA